MSHSNEEAIRAAYNAFVQGDLNGYLHYCTDNITFSVPGKGKISGIHKRDEFISPWVSGVIEKTNGTFRETVNDVFANDERAVVLVTHEFERNSRKFKYDSAHIYTIKDGKLDSFTEYPADLYYFDEAWS